MFRQSHTSGGTVRPPGPGCQRGQAEETHQDKHHAALRAAHRRQLTAEAAVAYAAPRRAANGD